MPYKVDKKQGGDNASNTKWMEKCVKRVMLSNSKYSKGQAVAICKTILKKRKEKNND